MDKNKEVKATGTKSTTVKADTTKTTATAAKTATVAAEKKETKATAKTEEKAVAKKATTTKKAPAKKTTTKKTTKKADIKTAVAVQFGGKEIFTENLIEQVKTAWVENFEGKLDEIKTIELYVKPEEMRAYFVVNGLSNGNYFINL